MTGFDIIKVNIDVWEINFNKKANIYYVIIKTPV